MDEKHRQLVQLAAAEVVKVMRERGMVAPGSAPGSSRGSAPGSSPVVPADAAGTTNGGRSTPAAAPIAPPLGTCTAGAPAASAPLTGVVTASRLQEAMDAAADGVAVLAPDARLSPLANDLARQHGRRVRRANLADTAAPAIGGDTAAASGPWLYWIMRTCPVADKIIAERRHVLTPMAVGRDAAALPQVMRDLAGAIKGGTTPGGILFVPSAARAMCYANRCPSIRAVVGTCDKAVEQGIDELGANVVVIEYPHHGPASMAASVDRMVMQPPRVSPQVLRELSELQRCG